LLEILCKLDGAVNGESVELANRWRNLGVEMRSAGDASLRNRCVPAFEAGLAIVERILGPASRETIPFLSALVSGPNAGPWDFYDHVGYMERYLEAVEKNGFPAEELGFACFAAERLVRAEASKSPEAAALLAQHWLASLSRHGAKVGELSYDLAVVQKKLGQTEESLVSLRRAIDELDPEALMAEEHRHSWRGELAEALRERGEPDAELEAALAAEREQWAEEWMASLRKKAPERAVVPLLLPYLVPNNRFGGVPWDVVTAIARQLPKRFLASERNARPTLAKLIEVCAPHAAITTFAGFRYEGVDIDALVTADTPEIREVISSADDIDAISGGLVSAWWD
jgi:tetratricopeptide (TPR) repeat protein